jgi:hypothetical protein
LLFSWSGSLGTIWLPELEFELFWLVLIVSKSFENDGCARRLAFYVPEVFAPLDLRRCASAHGTLGNDLEFGARSVYDDRPSC